MSDPVTHSQIRNSDQFVEGERGFHYYSGISRFPSNSSVILRTKCENPRQGSVMWSVNQVCWPEPRSWEARQRKPSTAAQFPMQLYVTTTTFLAIRLQKPGSTTAQLPVLNWLQSFMSIHLNATMQCNKRPIRLQATCRQAPFSSAAAAVECW